MVQQERAHRGHPDQEDADLAVVLLAQPAGVRDHQRVTPLGILSSWHSSGMGLLLCQHAFGETQDPQPTGLRTP